MKKKELKFYKNKIKSFFNKTFFFVKKTWFFTVLFFVIIFDVSVWIWWGSVFKPAPSEKVILEVQNEQRSFETKVKKIDLVIKKIQERKNLFENATDHQIERKIFKSKEEIFNEMNPIDSNNQNSSGVNRLP